MAEFTRYGEYTRLSLILVKLLDWTLLVFDELDSRIALYNNKENSKCDCESLCPRLVDEDDTAADDDVVRNNWPHNIIITDRDIFFK